MARRRILLFALLVGLGLAGPFMQLARAHQPFFEEEDIQADHPWQVSDPTISTAVYATLESAGDIDYFTFEGLEREVVLLQLTIPQIEGQEDFAPTMALLGPGLPQNELPSGIIVPENAGAVIIEPPPGPATTFYEPFSRTSYWERQEERVALPAAGRYVVAVWHPEAEVGRYTFVIGEKERLGGDLAFPLKMRSYWTPVVETAVVEPEPEDRAAWYDCAR
jgi:hypothetical protein